MATDHAVVLAERLSGPRVRKEDQQGLAALAVEGLIVIVAVGYSSASNLIVCPCHGSEFGPNTSAVVSPPAPHGLGSISVTVSANDELLVDG